MSAKKKDDEQRLKKVRLMLDNPYDQEVKSNQDKYLSALRKRLTESSLKPHDYRWYSKSSDDADYTPKVFIHKEEKSSINHSLETIENKIQRSFRVDFPDEELFEIEMVTENIPEFLEVIPKKEEKDEVVEQFEEVAEDEKDVSDLPKWEPVVETDSKEAIQENDSIADQGKTQPMNKFELVKEDKESEPEPVHLEQESQDFKEKSSVASEDSNSGVWEPINSKKKDISLKKKAEIFKQFVSIKTIDQETALLLYDNGIKNMQDLFETSVDELKDIKGLSDEKAEQIFAEVKKCKEMDSPTENQRDSLGKQKTEKKIRPVEGPSDDGVATYGDYTLYKKEISIGDNNTRVVHFFSKEQPKESDPASLPEGYEIKVNRKTGVPFIKKK